jgi:hypothetical protein
MTKPKQGCWLYAKQNNLPTYRGKTPCRRCGIFEKFTRNSECVNKCNRIRNAEYREYCRKNRVENKGVYADTSLGIPKPKLSPEDAWRRLSPDFMPDNLSIGWM